MNAEKKTFVLCIIALTIGIATTLPIAYFINIQSGVPAQTEPWLDADIVYANILKNHQGSSLTAVNIVANFTLTSELVNLGDVDAKIEVYKFHVYSDQGPIANLVYTFVVAKDIPDPKAPNGVTSVIHNRDADIWVFADNTIYNLTDVIGPIDGGGWQRLGHHGDTRLIEQGWTVEPVYGFLSAEKSERQAEALHNLQNAQTIYINATRVMTITYRFQANSDSSLTSTTNTLAHNETTDHIVLAKTDFGFTSGEAPDFMYDGTLTFRYMLPTSFTSSTIQLTSQVELVPFVFRKPVA